MVRCGLVNHGYDKVSYSKATVWWGAVKWSKAMVK